MRRVVAFVVAALVLAGCRARTDIVIRPDGSGRYAVTVEVPKDLQGGARGGEVNIGEGLEDVGFPLRIDEFETASTYGARLEFTFDDLRDFQRKVREIGDEDGDPNLAAIATGLRQAGDRWSFRYDGEPVEEDESGFDDLAAAFRVELALTLPGEPGRHNADAVRRDGDSTTFLWVLPANGATTMYAETVAALAGFPRDLAVNLIGIDVALLVVAYAATRRREG